MSQKQLQEKMLKYQTLEETLNQLNQRRELFTMKLIEIEQTKQTIEEVEKSKEADVFLPLGSGVFLPGKVSKKEKIIVGLGADIAVEKNVEEVKKVLEDRKKTLENGLEGVQINMLQVAQQMQTLQAEAQRLTPQSQKISAG